MKKWIFAILTIILGYCLSNLIVVHETLIQIEHKEPLHIISQKALKINTETNESGYITNIIFPSKVLYSNAQIEIKSDVLQNAEIKFSGKKVRHNNTYKKYTVDYKNACLNMKNIMPKRITASYLKPFCYSCDNLTEISIDFDYKTDFVLRNMSLVHFIGMLIVFIVILGYCICFYLKYKRVTVQDIFLYCSNTKNYLPLVQKEGMLLRDNYLDFLRGLAAISIVLIHTAFHSGGSYVSGTFMSITLAFDVPFFFFLAGWSSSFKIGNVYRSYRGLLYLWLKWVFFISAVTIFVIIIGKNDLSIKEFFYSLIFKTNITFFPSIGASVWFLPVYFKVIFVNAVVILLLAMYARKNINTFLKSLNIYIVLFLIFVLSNWKNLFSFDVFLLFYSFFFILGVIFGIKKDKNLTFGTFVFKLCGVTGLIFVCAYLISVPVFPMQSNKFPPNIVYLWYSLITILIAIFCRKFCHNTVNYINYIGKNAIWYYFSQGISSSILYHLVPLVHVGWILKLIIMFSINLALALLIAEIFKRFYEVMAGIMKNKILTLVMK